jgi:beta-lactamase class D
VRDISTLEPKGTRVLHGKTGAGSASDLESRSANHLVWQVGWIEGGATAVPYAAWLEVSGGTIDDARAKRDELLRASLAELDALLSASASVLARISLATTNT